MQVTKGETMTFYFINERGNFVSVFHHQYGIYNNSNLILFVKFTFDDY